MKTEKLSFTLIALSLMTGCAGMSQQSLDDRAARNLAYEERFKSDRAQCQAVGKRIVVDARSKVGRDGVPKQREPYYCV